MACEEGFLFALVHDVAQHLGQCLAQGRHSVKSPGADMFGASNENVSGERQISVIVKA